VFTPSRALLLVLASLAFGCMPGNNREASELVTVYQHVENVVRDMDTTERGMFLLLLGATIQTTTPQRQDEAPPIQIVGQLMCDVPAAGAKAGDRVVFRPDHPDWSRRCVVMHSTDAELFLPAIASGELEIIASPAAEDPRGLLRDLLRRPLQRLFRVV
jgi:hypothetical protein